jgi:hypothetical protein
VCEGSEHLNRAVVSIVESSGEGSILRLMGSRYIPGRTESLIKFKVFFFFFDLWLFIFPYQAAIADKEGLVVGVEEGNVTLKLYV